MDIKKLIEQIKEMKVVELNELVKAIEEEFGVTAAAPMAVAGNSTEEESKEKTLKLTELGGNKISVIKLVRELKGLGLMEAKQFVEALPAIVQEEASEEKVVELIAKFKEVGATLVAE